MFDTLTINVSTELFGLVFSLICLLISSFSPAKESFQSKSQKDIRGMFFCLSLILFSDAMAGLFRGKTGTLAFYSVNIGNFVQFAASYIMFGLLLQLITHTVPVPKGDLYRKIGWCAVALNEIMIITNLFTGFIYEIGEDNLYSRSNYFLLSQITGIICITVAVFYLIKYRKYATRRSILVFTFLGVSSIASLVVEMFIYGIAWFNISLILSITILFIYNQMSVARSLVDSEIKIAEQKLMLEQKRIQIMVSQIKPHFLFNTLTSIAQLCDESPETAQDLTISFANYLRANMKSLDEFKPQSFKDELEHIRNYLKIEKVRFGDRLNIEYDIRVRDFTVPMLSVQPIVENAVKHGVAQKPEGGTVKLSTDEDEKQFIITVTDDGVGFDTASIDSEKSIGLRNVELRLEIMEGANMKIDSTPGKGSKITIFIPKG